MIVEQRNMLLALYFKLSSEFLCLHESLLFDSPKGGLLVYKINAILQYDNAIFKL
jgi:hypothetical protein